ncbi:hypothetical protein CAPTEDRAFT_49208, partial [Capitella teleta]
WDAWTPWLPCTSACGGGSQSRMKICSPSTSDSVCNYGYESKSCGEPTCPVDGVWLGWSGWSVCSVSCDDGVQSRRRECYGPFQKGKPCLGSKDEHSMCNIAEC